MKHDLEFEKLISGLLPFSLEIREKEESNSFFIERVFWYV